MSGSSQLQSECSELEIDEGEVLHPCSILLHIYNRTNNDRYSTWLGGVRNDMNEQADPRDGTTAELNSRDQTSYEDSILTPPWSAY